MAISLVGTASADAGSGTAVSVTHGLTINSGDVVVAAVHSNGTANAVSDNNGAYAFTADTNGATPDSSTVYIFSRVAGGSEPSAYAFTLGASNRWAAIVRVYRGVDAAIWDVAPASASKGTTSFEVTPAEITLPDITVAAGACGLVFAGDDFAPMASYFSAIGNSYGNEKQETEQQCLGSWDRLGLSAGAMGSTTATVANTNASSVGWQCSLKPAAATGNPGFGSMSGGLQNPFAPDMTGGRT
jgi:hypothetical protein